jgi:putative hydrolase of the HAD superfamily
LKRYTFVLLDVGETLVGPRESFGAVYAQVLDEMGLELAAEILERSLRQVWLEMERLVPPGADRYAHFPGGEAGYWRRFARLTLEKAAGHPVEGSFVDEALNQLRVAFRDVSAWQVYPDVPPVLDALREDGVRMGVVSNWDSRLPRLLDDLGLAGYFDAVGVSHLEGLEKPDPGFFHRVLKRLGARPEQALHVGDVPELDLAGAAAAGVDALLVDRRGRLGGEYTALSNLSDLPRIARGREDGWPVYRPGARPSGADDE